MMNNEGYTKFTMHSHTKLWQSQDARNLGKGYGIWVADKAWHWYERWVDFVREHCRENSDKYA